jgi:hypothetical protein
LFGAVLLVAVRWAVLATAVLATVCLMAPLAQFETVKANPGMYDYPVISIDSPVLYPAEIYQETSIPIEVSVFPWGSRRTFVDISYSLDDNPNVTLGIVTYENSLGIFGKGTLSNLTDGNHTVKAYSTDTQGNTISSPTHTFQVNTTIRFPTLLLSPKNITYYNKEIPLIYTIDDPNYTVYYRIENYGSYQLDDNLTLPELSDGQHTITTRAYDLNFVLYSRQKVTFTIDTISPPPPEISILEPLSQTYDDSSVSLVFTMNMPVNWTGYPVKWMGYSLDGQDNVTVTGNTTITELPNGAHNVTVYARNAFGNTGASETLYFTIAKPFPATIVVASSVTVAVSGAVLLFYFKKRKH